MATGTDATTFRTISEDGELLSQESGAQTYHTLISFVEYAEAEAFEPGAIAQWYVPRTGDMLAESSAAAGLITYPAGDLFA